MDSESTGRPPRKREHEEFLLSVHGLIGSLTGISRRIVGSDDLASDAVQEALLSLWLQDRLPPNPRAWLIRTVVHRSLHLSRSRSRRRKHEERACLERAEGSDRDDPSRRLESEEVQQALDKALLDITREHREILMLKALSRMDYASISEQLQIPPGTVRSRLSRSRNALRQALLRSLPQEYLALLPHEDPGS